VAVLFVLVSILLVLVILIQKGRGGGLSGAFGGGMASGLLGSKTGDFLTWVTIVVVAIFLTFAVLLAKFYRPRVGEYGVQAPAPTSQPAAAPPETGAPAAPPAAPAGQAPAQPPTEQPGAAAPAPAPTGGVDANGSGR
jgi:preprotein translocase subunit SecG